MDTIIGFSILGGVVLVSVIISTVAYSREQARELKKSQIRQIKHRIGRYHDMLYTLLNMDKEYDLILMVHHQILGLLGKLLLLEPDNDRFSQMFEEEKILHTEYQNNKRTQEVSTVLTSDQEINAANFQLMQISKLILKNKDNNLLSAAKATELYNLIKKLRLNIEVNSHEAQAEAYIKNNDRILAQSHFKQAREALKNTTIEYPEKNSHIKTLSEKIQVLSNLATPTEENLTGM